MIDNSDISTGDIFAMLKGQTNADELKMRRIVDGIMRKVGDYVTRGEIEALTKGSAENRQDMKALGVKGFTRLVGKYVTEYEDSHTRTLKNALHESHDSFSMWVGPLARKVALRMTLAEREHIPNKIELQQARQAAAKARGHGPKKKGGSRIAKEYEERKLAQNPWLAIGKVSKQKTNRRRARVGLPPI